MQFTTSGNRSWRPKAPVSSRLGLQRGVKQGLGPLAQYSNMSATRDTDVVSVSGGVVVSIGHSSCEFALRFKSKLYILTTYASGFGASLVATARIETHSESASDPSLARRARQIIRLGNLRKGIQAGDLGCDIEPWWVA